MIDCQSIPWISWYWFASLYCLSQDCQSQDYKTIVSWLNFMRWFYFRNIDRSWVPSVCVGDGPVGMGVCDLELWYNDKISRKTFCNKNWIIDRRLNIFVGIKLDAKRCVTHNEIVDEWAKIPLSQQWQNGRACIYDWSAIHMLQQVVT